MSQLTVGLSATATPVQNQRSLLDVTVEIPAGPDPITLDLSAPAGFEAVPGVYPDLNARSIATMEIARPDGSGALVTRRRNYRLGGSALFRIPLDRVAPGQAGGAP